MHIPIANIIMCFEGKETEGALWGIRVNIDEQGLVYYVIKGSYRFSEI